MWAIDSAINSDVKFLIKFRLNIDDNKFNEIKHFKNNENFWAVDQSLKLKIFLR